MGYEDRDYMQSERGGGTSWMADYPICRFLILATVAVYALQIFVTRPSSDQDRQDVIEDVVDVDQMTEDEWIEHVRYHSERLSLVSIPENWLQLDTEKVVPGGQVWRLVTSVFVHDRFFIWQIIVNMALLFWFGRQIEGYLGSREFLAFYLTAAVLSSLAFILLQLGLGESVPALGASGPVLAVVCLYAILNPSETVNLFFFIPIQMRFLLLLYGVYVLHPVLLKLAGTPVYTGTAHAAHLGGILFGYVYWKSGWRLTSLMQGMPKLQLPKSTPKENRSSRNPRQDQRLDATVDSILQKISEQGESSLTEQERAILDEASRQYRKRQND